MDWTAIAIVVVPLAVLALLEIASRAPHKVSLQPWQGDVTLETMPLAPDLRSRAQVAIAEPPPMPWQGDVAVEDMPVAPDTRSRTQVATTEPSPSPWEGDVALEDMPVALDTRTRTPIIPVTGAAAAMAAAAPICVPDASLPRAAEARAPPVPPPHAPLAFGRALAAAARDQLDDFVIYNARYMSIAYPRGDTQPLYGVCTDVVVRAYRALGIDLQELIHTSRVGRGDPSIDHRRVEVIRRFLERHGTSLDISEFAEDYLPGDIVTYHRPQGRVSQHHIAVVSDRMAPSGRPMIVHNRGWGPQLEDALFVDKITGHYRFAPGDVEAYVNSRQPRPSERHRTADVVGIKRR